MAEGQDQGIALGEGTGNREQEEGAREPGSKGARERGSQGAREQGSQGARVPHPSSRVPHPGASAASGRVGDCVRSPPTRRFAPFSEAGGGLCSVPPDQASRTILGSGWGTVFGPARPGVSHHFRKRPGDCVRSRTTGNLAPFSEEGGGLCSVRTSRRLSHPFRPVGCVIDAADRGHLRRGRRRRRCRTAWRDARIPAAL